MTCRETVKIGAYLSGRLRGKDQTIYETHLLASRRCQPELKIFSTLKETLQEKESQLPKIDIVNKVLARLPETRPVWNMAAPHHKPKKKGEKR